MAGAIADAQAMAVRKVNKNACFRGAGILMGKTNNKRKEEVSMLESDK